jgi:hypothetical protein
MTRRLTTLLAVLAVCAGALGVTANAHAAKGMEIALQDDPTFVFGLSNPFKGLDKARALNATYIRANVFWNATLGKQAKKKKKPRKLRYDWRHWDDLINRARDRGMGVELTLTGPAPRWAAKKASEGYVKNPNAKYFGEFARAAAKHFSARGVHRYSIWNEPNLRLWLSPLKRAPRIYRKLYSAAYKQIKSVGSDNLVWIGETAPYGTRGRTTPPLKFLRGVTCVDSSYRNPRCGPLKTDGYAHHPYDYKHKPTYRYPGKDNATLATLSHLTKGLSRLAKSRALTTPSGGTPYVYLTEYGYFAGANYKLPQKTQAKYLVKGFQMAQKNKRVKQMLQFLLVPAKRGQPSFFATQIMTRNFKPLKAYTALKRWAAKEAARGGIATSP